MMKVPYTLLVAAATAVGIVSASDISRRDERLLFSANPLVCEGTNGHQGVCLPFGCEKYEANAEGTCLVVGNCCVVQRSCGQSSSARITHFNNDLLSTNDLDTCSVSITTSDTIGSKAICQLHVTLEKMQLTYPTAEGACEDQYLQVRGGKKDSIKVCGIADNQTLVVDVEGLAGPFKVSVVSTVENVNSEWDVRVEQVPCGDAGLAPDGCDQLVTGLSGEVKSFNYDTVASTNLQANDKPGSRHLQESYKICVRQETGYCSIRWTADSDDYAFTLTGNQDPVDFPFPIFFGVGLNGDCLFTDYLVVTDAYVEGEEDNPVFVLCGSKFPDALITNSWEVRVVADDQEFDNEDIDNRGFHLMYEQQKC